MPGHAQPHHAPVVPGHALAAAFPAVHPLAVVVILAGDEHRLGRVDQPRLVGEEIVGGIDHLGPQPRLGEVDIVAAKVVEHGHSEAKRAARRKPAMRWIWAIAVANSAAGSLSSRVGEGGQDVAARQTLHRDDEGECPKRA